MKDTGLRVVNCHGFLVLTDAENNGLGCQTDLNIKNSIDDRDEILVTVTFKMRPEDIIIEKK